MSRFRAVEELCAEYTVKRLCRVVEVSRSGYYAWRTRGPSPRALENQDLLGVIRQIHAESRGTYGSPRVWGQLRRRGVGASRGRVARLMARDGLVGAHARKKWRRGRPDIAPAPDLLERDFTADRPNQRWVADLAQFPTGEGPLHVAAIRDLCHRGIVGWAMDDHAGAELVVNALTMALGRTVPDAEGLVHHSDRGSQYTSAAFTAAADLAGLRLSFGRPGDAYDNAAMETVWGTIKREITWMRGTIRFETREEARHYLFEYIEIFYNRQRHQTRLGHQTPVEFATAIAS
ncbi:MAG: IS3 family transposase [Actinobacteria bacterium]|nr:IS3 family transposase [Actinomycetota bacterium]